MKKIVFYFIHFILISFLWACENKNNANIRIHTTKDDFGRTLQLPVKIDRIFSVSPSITEIIYKLGLEKKLVARTIHCNYPLRVLTKKAIEVYPLDIEKLILLKPQVVFALKGFISDENVEKLSKIGIQTYFVECETVQQTIDAHLKIGKVMDADYVAEIVRDTMTSRLHKFQKKISSSAPKLKALVVISPQNLYVFGAQNYVSDMLYYANLENVVPKSNPHQFPTLSVEQILQLNPDLIIYPASKTDKSHNSLAYFHPALRKLKAIEAKNEYFIDEDIIVRPGPRIIEGIEKLSQIKPQN